MTAALIAALVCTVALLVVTAYFLMGSVPLLVLAHDTPKDSRFVRGFFNTYYRAAAVTAGATALSYLFAERAVQASGAAALMGLAMLLRRRLVPRMDALSARIQGNDAAAIGGFKRVHLAAIVINLLQLALIVWSLIALSLQLK